jgi:hypothetical protein
MGECSLARRSRTAPQHRRLRSPRCLPVTARQQLAPALPQDSNARVSGAALSAPPQRRLWWCGGREQRKRGGNTNLLQSGVQGGPSSRQAKGGSSSSGSGAEHLRRLRQRRRRQGRVRIISVQSGHWAEGRVARILACRGSAQCSARVQPPADRASRTASGAPWS